MLNLNRFTLFSSITRLLSVALILAINSSLNAQAFPDKNKRKSTPPDPNQQVLMIEQDYTVIEGHKVVAKEITQRLFLTPQWIRIENYEKGANQAATEIVLIDQHQEQIITLSKRNNAWTKHSVSYTKRRISIDKRRRSIAQDLRTMKAGPEKDKVERKFKALLYRGEYKLVKGEKADQKKIVDVETIPIAISDPKDKSYLPMKAYLHPQEVLPYESAEILYLLQIIGPEMARFLKKHKKLFQHLPMEMTLQLANGGMLSTRVKLVKKQVAGKLKKNLFTQHLKVPEKVPTRKPANQPGEVEPD